jgi:hypothetical protein
MPQNFMGSVITSSTGVQRASLRRLVLTRKLLSLCQKQREESITSPTIMGLERYPLTVLS